MQGGLRPRQRIPGKGVPVLAVFGDPGCQTGREKPRNDDVLRIGDQGGVDVGAVPEFVEPEVQRIAIRIMAGIRIDGVDGIDNRGLAGFRPAAFLAEPFQLRKIVIGQAFLDVVVYTLE